MVLSVPLERAKKIALLNDAFRSTFLGGMVCVTAAVNEGGEEFVKAALLAVREFDDFGQDNDPYHEHDFGALEIEGRKVFWKIDYFDPTMMFGSEDPANKKITRRVLTVMFAEEY